MSKVYIPIRTYAYTEGIALAEVRNSCCSHINVVVNQLMTLFLFCFVVLSI